MEKSRNFGGLGGAQGGRAKCNGGFGGSILGHWSDAKSLKNHVFYVYFRYMGFPGGVPGWRQKVARRTPARLNSRRGQNLTSGAKKGMAILELNHCEIWMSKNAINTNCFVMIFEMPEDLPKGPKIRDTHRFCRFVVFGGGPGGPLGPVR